MKIIDQFLELIEVITKKKITVLDIDEQEIQKTLELINIRLIPIVEKWLHVGFSSAEASEWISQLYIKDSIVNPKEIFIWLSEGFSKEEYLWAKRNYRSLGNMKEWRAKGYSFKDVRIFEKQKIRKPKDITEKAVIGKLGFTRCYDFQKMYKLMNLNKEDLILEFILPESIEEKNYLVFRFENSNDNGVLAVYVKIPEQLYVKSPNNYMLEILKGQKIKIKDKYFRDFISTSKNNEYELKLDFFINRVIIEKKLEHFSDSIELPETRSILPYYDTFEVPEYWIGDYFDFEGIHSEYEGREMELLAILKINIDTLMKADNEFLIYEDEEGDKIKRPINLDGSVEIYPKRKIYGEGKQKNIIPSFIFRYNFDLPNKEYNAEMTLNNAEFMLYRIDALEINNYDAHTSVSMSYFRRMMDILRSFKYYIKPEIEFRLWLPKDNDPKKDECIFEVSSKELRIFLLSEEYGG